MNGKMRLLSLILVIVMLLPMISIPTFAEESAEIGYFSYSEDFNEAAKPFDVILNHSSTPKDTAINVATKDADKHGNVIEMAATPAAPGEYYLVNSSSRSSTLITDYTVTDGKLSGKAGSTTITDAVINTSSLATTIGTANLFVATGAVADAYTGYVGGNTAAPMKLLHPQVEGAGDYILLSFDLYLSSDFLSKQGLQGRAQALKSAGGTANLELFNITATAGKGYATFAKHGNGTNVYDTGATLTLGAWHTISYMIDRETKLITAYADGVLAYQTSFSDKSVIAAPLVMGANSFAIENGRMGTPSVMRGYVQVDNFSVVTTDDAALAGTVDFEGKTLGNVSAAAPSGASVATATKDSANHGSVLHMISSPVPAYDYYLWTDSNKKWPIKNATVADGKVSGTSDKGDVVDAVIPTSDSDTSKKVTVGGTEYTLVTGAYADAIGGVGNFSNPLKVKSPALASGKYVTYSFDIYLSSDFFMNQGFTARVQIDNVVGGKATYARIELFRIWMSGQNAVFGQHNNAYNMTSSGNRVLTKDAWHTLTFVIDRETSIVSAFADSVFVFQAVAYKANTDAYYQYVNGADVFPLQTQANTFQFENNRGSGNLNNKGFVEIDNFSYTTGENALTHNSLNVSFESSTVGNTPAEGFATIDAVGTAIMDNYGSKAWNIPNNGNANKNPALDNPYYSHAVDKTLVWEADYFIENGAKGQLQAQFRDFTATWGDTIPTKDVTSGSNTYKVPNNGGQWLDLYQINYTGNGFATLKFENGGRVHEKLGKTFSLATGRWHNVALVIDLSEGYYDLYINGNLVNGDIPLYRQGYKLTNITVNADKMVIGKVNANQSAYEGNIQLDNIRVHQGDRPTMGAENTEYYDFEDYKYVVGEKFASVANSATRPMFLEVGSVAGDTALRLPLIASGSEDEWALLRSDGKAFLKNYVPSNDPTKGTLDGTEITLEADDKGVYWYTSGSNKYKPVSLALAGTAVGDDNNCRATKLTHGNYSYENAKTLLIEVEYFIEEGSDGKLEIQFERYKSGGTDGTYLTLFTIDTAKASLGNSSKKLPAGQWHNIKVMLDLAAGTWDVYVNDEFSHHKDGGKKNLEVGYSADSMISIAKIARETSSAVLNKGAIYFDDVRIATDAEAQKVLATDMLMDVVNGASIRLKDENTGLRFATRVNESAIDVIKAYLGASDVTVGKRGTLIAPESYYLTANSMTHEALEALPVSVPYVDVAFGGEYFGGDAGINLPEGDYMVGSIVNIKDYARSFAAVGYIELIVDGESYVLYTDVVVRSAAKVASAALADTTVTWSDAHKAILETFAGVAN